MVRGFLLQKKKTRSYKRALIYLGYFQFLFLFFKWFYGFTYQL